MYGICNLSVVPCRKEPNDRSEMVTQLLFGEHFYILESLEKWVHIKTAYDNYECWIDKKQFLPITDTTFISLEKKSHVLTLDLVQVMQDKNQKTVFPVIIGSTLPGFHSGNCKIENEEYYFYGQSTPFEKKTSRSQVIETAYLFLNSPYLWGGRSPFGIDCSGFTQMVFKLNGIKLERDSSKQAEQGIALSFVDEAQPGDLAFFDNQDGKIIHTGIVLPEGKIIHASGKVRVDTLDHNGIFNAQQNKYSHQLRVIKSIEQLKK